MTITYKGLWDRKAKNSKGIRSYTRSFKLTTTEETENEYDVGSHPSLPVIGQSHPSDPLAWCVDIEVDNAWPKFGWLVTAHYDSSYEMNENPLNEPVRVSFDGEKYQVVAVQDNDGAAIINSAGDYYADPPVLRDKTGLVIRLSKNLAAVPTYVINLPDAVNSTTFTVSGLSLSARQAKVDRVAVSERQERNGIFFYTLSVDINCRSETWDMQPLQCGFTYLKDGKRVRATNEGDNTPVTTPVLLDSAGGMITDPLPSQAVYGSFRVYTELDFNTYLPLT